MGGLRDQLLAGLDRVQAPQSLGVAKGSEFGADIQVEIAIDAFDQAGGDRMEHKVALCGRSPKRGAKCGNTEGTRVLEAQIRQLEVLLEGDFVDLSSLCSEIRSWPEFENLAMELTFALGLAVRGSPVTVEDSIVLLGTGRLRALMYAMFLLQYRIVSFASPGDSVRSAENSSRSVAEAGRERRASRGGWGEGSPDDLLGEIPLLSPRRS